MAKTKQKFFSICVLEFIFAPISGPYFFILQKRSKSMYPNVHPSPQTYIRPHTHVYKLYTPNTYIHPHTHMYKHPTHIHTYKLPPQRQKSANSRFFSFALGAFAFFRAFFSSRSHAFFLASRSRAQKCEKSADAQLCI